VRASGDCPWTASSNLNWANIIYGGSGNGDGTVTYAAYVKEGKNPITDGFLVLLSNIAIAIASCYPFQTKHLRH